MRRPECRTTGAAAEDIEHLHNFEAFDNTDFNVIDAADAADAIAQLQLEQRAAARAVSGLDFDIDIRHAGRDMSLRMIHIHMIQEYARHNGHADLLREAIDGTTGR